MRSRTVVRRYATEALALALAIAGQIELWARPGARPDAVVVVAALVATVPLLLRQRFPFGAPACVFAGLALIALASSDVLPRGTSFTLFALMLAFWAAGAQRERQPAIAGAAIGLAAVVVLVAVGHGGVVQAGNLDLGLFIWTLIAVGLPLGAFVLGARAQRAAELEQRADELEREREERTHAAVAAERSQIARDLHDVIAHSVTVMTVQVGAARLLLDGDPRRAREPLLVVEQTGHQALADMRRLVGIVHHGDERERALAPQPGLADLPALADQMRRAGLPTVLAVHGEPQPLTPGIELTAYRVVQEALTNTLKHAGPARARVTVSYEPHTLALEISDDGVGAASRQRGGHGLLGMRERIGLYGGELEAGPEPAGGFAVRARIPMERQSEVRDPTASACTADPPAG